MKMSQFYNIFCDCTAQRSHRTLYTMHFHTFRSWQIILTSGTSLYRSLFFKLFTFFVLKNSSAPSQWFDHFSPSSQPIHNFSLWFEPHSFFLCNKTIQSGGGFISIIHSYIRSKFLWQSIHDLQSSGFITVTSEAAHAHCIFQNYNSISYNYII